MAIALLVVLARNAPGTTSPFSSLLDPVTLTCTLFSWRALRNVNHAGKKVNSYSIEFKLEAIRFAWNAIVTIKQRRSSTWTRREYESGEQTRVNKNLLVASESGSPGREESLLIWLLKKCCWNGSTDDALMVFVYQGK